MILIGRRAIDDIDAEHMRRIRNTCASFMTSNRDTISIEQQRAWWITHRVNGFEPFLFSVVIEPIGYGLIKTLDNRKWLTGGLIPEYRSKGLGRELFQHLIDAAGLPCWLEVRTDNVRARRLYASLGFEVTAQTDGADAGSYADCIYVMRKNP